MKETHPPKADNTTREYYLKNLGIVDLQTNTWTWYVTGADRVAKITPLPHQQPAAMDSSSTVLNDTLAASFYLYDHLGNTRVVYTPEIQCPGYLIHTVDYVADYYPYGKTLRKYTNGPTEKFLTTQHERDVETGLDYRGARFYDADVARFLSLDPHAANYPSLSDYNYVAGNPLAFTDPSGKDVEDNGNETRWTENHSRLLEAFGDSYGFNELIETAFTPVGLKNVTITISGTPNGKTYLAQTYPSRDGLLYEVPVYTLTVSGTNSSGSAVSKEYDVLRFMPFLNRAADATGYSTISESVIMSGLADARNAPSTDYNENYEIHNTYSPENGGFVIYGNFMIHDGPDDLVSDYGWGAAGCMEVCGAGAFADLKSVIYSLSGSARPQDEGLNDLVNAGKLIIVLERASRPVVIAP